MSTSAAKGIEVHGRALDMGKRRVSCNYCEKIVGGYNRLKHHLGGVGHDVVACMQVPPDVKAEMNRLLLDKKREKLLKEVGTVEHPELPWKRVPIPVRRLEGPKLVTPHHSMDQHSSLAKESTRGRHDTASSKRKQKKRAKVSEPGTSGYKSLPASSPMAVHENIIDKVGVNNKHTSTADSYIGRFFFDAGIDPILINLPLFQRMVDGINCCGAEYKAPRYEELRGQVLKNETLEVSRRVDEIKRSWVKTGCSILLDGWTSDSGRELIRFLVSCPEGMIFLRSMDATDAMNNSDMLYSMVSEIIEVVGPRNVVQVVAHKSTDVMDDLRTKIIDGHETLFLTLCADYSINFILERIGKLDHVKKVMNDARTLTSFIYGNELASTLMKKYITVKDLVVTSNFKSIAAFITLKNIFSQKDQLIDMLNSMDWINSGLAFWTKGMHIAELVNDCQFWNACFDVLLITDPIVSILPHINGVDNYAMGFLYDSMVKAKLTIRSNVKASKAKFKPVWAIIDNIWDDHLYCKLHAAGYNLNALLFYSNDFCDNHNILIDLMYCNVRMTDSITAGVIVEQFAEFKVKRGGFGEVIAMEQLQCLSPDKWWAVHGSQYPEMQRWAIRVLSQNCNSATRCMLKKDATEKLHSGPMNRLEQQKLRDIEFVSNNRQLWRPRSSQTIEAMFCHEVLDPSSDWVIDSDAN